MRRDEVLRVLARFQDLKRDELGIMRIGVFGSVARDEMVETSDVDVVVEVARPDLLTLVAIKQELEELPHLPSDAAIMKEQRADPTIMSDHWAYLWLAVGIVLLMLSTGR